jgi:hypothetical protein
MKDVIKVATDPYVPRGQCAVLINGKAVYVGRLGKPTVLFLIPDALLVLNPEDFAEGDAFIKKQLN